MLTYVGGKGKGKGKNTERKRIKDEMNTVSDIL